MHRFTALLFLISLFSFPLKAAELKVPGQELGLVPHKALYKVELESARSGSQVVNISGQMYYEWGYDCDAWTSKHRFNVLYEYADNPTMRVTSDFSNFEAFDGSTLDFSVIREQNGRQYEEIRGHADAYPDQEGRASFNQPPGLEHDLPKGVLYPTMHTIKVIEAAKRGEKFYNAVIFDGSDDEGPVEVNAFMGKKVEGLKGFEEESIAIDQKLLEGEAQEIQLAFFPLKTKQKKSIMKCSWFCITTASYRIC